MTIPDAARNGDAPQPNESREDAEREKQDERAFPDRDPAQKKTGEF